MKRYFLVFAIFITTVTYSQQADAIQTGMPIKGFCIAAPMSDGVSQFTRFIEEELGSNGINTLILRIDFNYQFQSYPNLSDEGALSKKDVKKLVDAAKKNNINLIPQINLLGHQSWSTTLNSLLKEYPQFDETPHVQLPEEYEWPNSDSLYCKSYCPLHPGVHEVVFALVDEIMAVFEAADFHAGMDEVFYIGDDKCPRCSGKNKAELFANEVTKIRDHLTSNKQRLWIWGDRLLDGKTTGMGMWEASENNTHQSIDMIPLDVVICDWHYHRASPSVAMFALKGFDVISCPWNKAEVATAHMEMVDRYRINSNDLLKDRFLGVMQTVWSPADQFLKAYYDNSKDAKTNGQVESFKSMLQYISEN